MFAVYSVVALNCKVPYSQSSIILNSTGFSVSTLWFAFTAYVALKMYKCSFILFVPIFQ